MAGENKTFITLTDILVKAIAFEESSALFYHEMKNKAPSENVRDLLDTLEREERQHKRVLTEGLEREHEDVLKIDRDEEYIEFPQEMNLLMPVIKKKDPTFEELLDFAIEREVQSAIIYETTAMTAPVRLRSWFIGLSKFERNHEVMLLDLKKM